MRILKATGNRGFEVLDIPATEEENGLVKLKIETIFPTMSDVAVYEGKLEINYPVAPCRLATAVVSEDRPEYGLKRGSKVLLNPYILNSADEDGYTELGVYGINDDGFLRNFISLPIDNIIPFPEDVKEDEAVFVDVIAIALNALNKLDVQKGDYIAILGGSVLNLVIAQLALYYQAIPILVSSDDRYLELADSHGVYYTINDSRDNVHIVIGQSRIVHLHLRRSIELRQVIRLDLSLSRNRLCPEHELICHVLDQIKVEDSLAIHQLNLVLETMHWTFVHESGIIHFLSLLSVSNRLGKGVRRDECQCNPVSPS